MRENAPPARPTLADRQVPASSSTEHGHLSPPFQSSEVEVSKACALPADVIGCGDGVASAAADMVEPAAFYVFKIARNGGARPAGMPRWHGLSAWASASRAST